MIISAIKDNKMIYGQLPKIAKKLGVEPETLRRWRRNNITIATYNEYIIYFDTEKVL